MGSRAATPADRPLRTTTVSLDAALVAEARALGLNLSRACERGLREQIVEARAERWRADNAAALAASNAYVEEHGLPLGRARLF